MGHKKVRLLSVMLLLGLGLTTLQAQNTLNVKDKAGTKTSILLSDMRNMTFPSGNLTIANTDGTSTSFALADIQNLSFTVIDAVKINANNQSSKIDFFPNPVLDELHLNYASNNSEALRLEIFDIQGKILYQQLISSQNGTNNVTLDVSQLHKGLYLCRLKGSDKFETIKFIKN